MPEAQESYANLKLILEELQLSKIPHTISADLKVDLNIVGKQQASCRNNCPFGTGAHPKYEECKLLTVGDLKDYLKKFRDSGGDIKEAMHYQNVINEMLLLNVDDDTLIIDCINIPELHILLGVVARVMKFLEDICSKKRIDAFLKSINLSRDKGRSSLNGNDSVKFLENLQKFEGDTADFKGDKRKFILAAIDCLETFKQVKHACFGIKLEDNYVEKIQVFKSKYKILKINPTLKVHLLDHVEDFLDRKEKLGYPKTGLGFYSEQAFESAHKKWKDF